jgi:hypothetical protein
MGQLLGSLPNPELERHWEEQLIKLKLKKIGVKLSSEDHLYNNGP